MRTCCLCKKKLVRNAGPFFKIPQNEWRRKKWVEICKVQFSANARICADHFLSTDIIKGAKINTLMPSAVPFVPRLLEDSIPVGNLIECPAADWSFASADLNNNCHVDLNLDISMGLNREHCEVPEKMVQYTDGQTQKEEDLEVPEQIMKYKDVETQTDPIIIECTLQMHYEELQRMIKNLQAENKQLKYKLAEKSTVLDKMSSIFTEGQIRKMMTSTHVRWKWEDISSAICLHASGPRAYNHLFSKGFPLPHVSTLQRWCRKINVREGLLSTSIDLMKHKTDLTSEEKICVLAFDEIKISETYEYDAPEDLVRKPTNYVQVVMARGLRKSWKLPVFYDFDCQMQKDILYSIITELNNAGFTVVAMVCDMGSTNRKLWKDLGVTIDRPWFPNPVNPEEKVFAFADAPHLLKLIRNHFLDSGLVYNNELVTSRTIADLMRHTSNSDVSIAYKLTDEHLSVKGAGRQKVSLATQLFSNTTANAIRRCYSVGMDLYKPTEPTDFIQLVNDWFDVLNSNINTFGYPGKEPYGLALEEQQRILERMNQFMKSLIIPNKKTLEWFQKGVIMTNTALEMLRVYI